MERVFVHIVVGDQDADIAVFQPGHHRLYIFHRDGVYPRKGLIQQDEFGVHRQRAAISVRLLSPPLRLSPLFLRTWCRRNSSSNASSFVFSAPPGKFGHFQHRFYIVFHAQFAKHRGLCGR